MADFLGRLAARSLGVAPVAQPVIPAMFAAGGSAERWSPEAGSVAGTAVGQMDTAPSPNTQSRTTIENAPLVEEINSNPRAEQPPLLANTIARSNASSIVAGSVSRQIRSESSNRNRTPILAPDNTQQENAGVVTSVIPGARQSLNSFEQIVTPTTIQSTREPAPPGFLSSSYNDSGSRSRSSARASLPAAPVVRVSIGRVEVRAEFPAPASRPSVRQATPPTLSVEEYARQRSEGKR
jgi:hypothetical protein